MAVQGYSQIMRVDSQANLPANADVSQLAFCVDVQSTFIWNGAAWMPLGRVMPKKSTVVINAKTTGATKIYTLEPAAFNFYPTQVITRASNISGVTVAPTLSVGTNATSYNNINSASLLSSLLSTLGAGGGAPSMATYSPSLAGGTDIYANVSIGAVATNYSITIDILGYYDT